MASSTEATAFRKRLVESGAAEEMLRTMVGLGEASLPPPKGQPYVQSNIGQGTNPYVMQPPRRAGPLSYELVQENKQLKDRVAELSAELSRTRKELKDKLPEGSLTISGIAAFGVPDVDEMGDISDPYVRVSVLDVPNLDDDGDVAPDDQADPNAFAAYCERHGIAAQTSVVKNSVNPSWPDETLSIVLPAGTPRPPKVLVRVWDHDWTNAHDPIASAEVQLEAGGGELDQLVCKGRGDLPDVTVNFTYTVVLDPNAA